MWAIYNRMSGEWWTGLAWGPLDRARLEPSQGQIAQACAVRAQATPTADGRRIDYDDLALIDLDSPECLACQSETKGAA